jgi:hypothetical protein
MSHFTEIKTQIKDIEALRLACQERSRRKFNLPACEADNNQWGWGLGWAVTGSAWSLSPFSVL